MSRTSLSALDDLKQLDKDNVYDLYVSSFDTAIGERWSKQGLADILALEGVYALVLKCEASGQGNGLLGFIIWRIVAGEAELLNVAVRPEYRQKGFGTKLLEGMLAALEQTATKKVFLEVREGNTNAQKLYNSLGFKVSGRRRDYYEHVEGGREDALLMSKLLMAD